MRKLTIKEKALLHEIFEKVMEINNNGYQLWFEIQPHVEKISFFYYINKKDAVLKSFKYEELGDIVKYLDDIVNKNMIVNYY